MPNNKKDAALVQETKGATFTHETGNQTLVVNYLSEDSQKEIFELVFKLFGNNQANVWDYEEDIWTMLQLSVSSSNVEDVVRENFVIWAKENITIINLLYKLFTQFKSKG